MLSAVPAPRVYGYVGNKSATFPLQLHGFDVSNVNSVQLSNHTGYGLIRGQILGGPDLESLMEGMRTHGLLRLFSHVLTGYIGSKTFLRTVVAAVRELRALTPSLMYVCDPVLGDDGKCYVPEELVDVYREEVVPLATLLTPNQFELELLTRQSVTDVASAFAAIDILHASGTETVVVTSSTLPAGQDATMLLIASTPWSRVEDRRDLWAADEFGVGPHARFGITIPKIPSKFTGTGDLTAALLLAFATAHPRDLPSVCERVLGALRAVCLRTLRSPNPGPAGPPAELRLIESKRDIEDPVVDDSMRAFPLKP